MKPEPQNIDIHGSMAKDTVEFENKPASQSMNTARQVSPPDGHSCDTTKRPIKDKCTINWKCSDDLVDRSPERMA